MADQNANTFLILVKSVSSPGTAEQLTQYRIQDGYSVWVTARLRNTQNMYVAFTQANAQSDTARKELQPGQSFELRIDDTSRIWYDAQSSSDQLEFTVQYAT